MTSRNPKGFLIKMPSSQKSRYLFFMVVEMEEFRRLIYHGEDYGDYYEISNAGKLRNAKEKDLKRLHMNAQGYLAYCGSIKGHKILFKVHRAVAETFIPNTQNKPQVNHINGVKTDNYVENLEWATNQENAVHAHNANLTNEESKRLINKNRRIPVVGVYEASGQSVRFESAFAAAVSTGVEKGSIRGTATKIRDCCKRCPDKVYKGATWHFDLNGIKAQKKHNDNN